MSIFTIFTVSTQGMTAQRERLEAAAANLANANSTRTSNGKIYQRRDVIFAAQDVQEEWMQNVEQQGFDYKPAQGVKTEVKLASEDQFILQHQPWHPDADANGNVKMPDVDPLEETINMMSASRSFEANATVFNTAKELAKISLNLNDA